MALDDFQMPTFKDPDGSTYIWDSSTQSYVKAPLTDKRPDQSHATGGDNDLFDPFQHTEMDSVPELEGYMAKKANDEYPPSRKTENWTKKAAWHDNVYDDGRGQHYLDCPFCGSDQDYRASLLPGTSGGNLYHCKECGKYSDPNMTGSTAWDDHPQPDDPRLAFVDEPPFPKKDEVKCPNCGETTSEVACPTCQKDLTPEWNTQGQQNEFFDAKPDFNDATEHWTWPQNVPHQNPEKTDNSFPSMSLSKTAEALPTDNWDDMFAGEAPMRTEAGRWVEDINGQLHVGMGNMLHDQIAARDGLDLKRSIALGSVYNDGTADVQQVFQKDYFDLEQVEHLLQQAFGQVSLSPPLGLADFEQKGHVFPPTDIRGGQWFIPPYTGTITGVAWVKERSEGVQYQPNMIMVAEHLRPDDVALWSKGSTAIITAVGGAASHAAYLAMTETIPVIVAIGDSYNKVETGNYLKIEPTSETITVMPGATSAMPSEQKHDIWKSILDYQRQRGGSVRQPTFSHFFEELAWKEANGPNLEECPECRAPMFDRNGESQCGDCGHKQRVIEAGAAALPLAAEAVAGGGEAAAGGGMSGIGGLMTKALRPGFGMGYAMGGGHGGGGGEGGGGSAGPAPVPFDPNAGTVAHTSMQHEAFLSEIWGLVQNALQAIKGGASAINWNGVASAIAANPIDDAAIGGLAAVNQHVQNQYQQATSATTFGEEEVGVANKNDGTNSTDEASNSGTEGKKEQGDGPEQLKDVDGGHDSQDSAAGDNLKSDPQMQDKALKAFHMNLPLVIEFAGSDEAGSDNPLLAALDAMLEEAFPGYKGGFDEEAGATTEHPQEESETPEERDEDASEPDKKSEGADKKEAAKLSKEGVWHFAIQGGEPSAWAVRDSINAPTQWGQQQPQLPAQPPQVQGSPEGFQPADDLSPGNVIAAYPDGTIVLDDGITTHNTVRAQEFAAQHGWSKQATLDPSQAPMGGTPAGAGGPAMQICPRCGQAHTAGAPCPVADVTTPLTTGDPTAQIAPTNKVVTKWKLAMPSNVPASQPQMAAGAPAAPSTCPTCGCNHIPGTPCPQSPQQMQQPGTGGANMISPPVGPGVAYSAFEDHLKDLPEVTSEDNPNAENKTYHSDDDWKDEAGTPLQEGGDYEMKTAHSPIPDRVTIERILPEKLTYLIHSGDVDYRDTITRDQLDLDGAVFSALDTSDTGEDSMDTFSDEEMPVRPGQDALPQQDDISSPSTTVSHTHTFTADLPYGQNPGDHTHQIEPVSLDNYTGSYAGDAPDDRSWLIEGDSSEVTVDPTLMAKMAGKDFSAREQREFIDEKGTARNLDRLDLEGTHYIDDELGISDSMW